MIPPNEINEVEQEPEEIDINDQLNIDKKNELTKHIWFLIFILILFIVEYFTRDPLFNISLESIQIMQNNMPSIFYYIAQFFTFFVTDKGLVLMIVIFYNYLNIFKTFILFVSALGGAYIGGVFKLIYISPRPFMKSPFVVAMGCEGGWGNPSNHAICSTCFYLALFELTIRHNKKLSKASKIIIYISDWIFIVCVCCSRVFLGVHGINQVVFGMCLGFCFYYIMFKFIKIKEENPHALENIILNYKKNILFICILIIIGLVPYFIFIPNQNDVAAWNQMIIKYCPNFPDAKKFECESLMCIWTLSTLIFVILGMSVEYYYFFKAYSIKWIQYNFDYFNKLSLEKLLNENEVNREINLYRWNRTNFCQSLKRFVIILCISAVLMIPHFIISYNHSFFLVMSVKILLPVYLVTFSMFTYIKKACAYFKCSNVNIFGYRHSNESSKSILNPESSEVNNFLNNEFDEDAKIVVFNKQDEKNENKRYEMDDFST